MHKSASLSGSAWKIWSKWNWHGVAPHKGHRIAHLLSQTKFNIFMSFIENIDRNLMLIPGDHSNTIRLCASSLSLVISAVAVSLFSPTNHRRNGRHPKEEERCGFSYNIWSLPLAAAVTWRTMKVDARHEPCFLFGSQSWANTGCPELPSRPNLKINSSSMSSPEKGLE